jgi:predicted metal-binding protein
LTNEKLWRTIFSLVGRQNFSENKVNRYKVIGINDDESHCECCGRTGLMRVVWIEDTETNEVKHFGTTCAQRPELGFNLKDEIKKAVKEANQLQEKRILMASCEYRNLGGKYERKDQYSWTPANHELFLECRAKFENWSPV